MDRNCCLRLPAVMSMLTVWSAGRFWGMQGQVRSVKFGNRLLSFSCHSPLHPKPCVRVWSAERFEVSQSDSSKGFVVSRS